MSILAVPYIGDESVLTADYVGDFVTDANAIRIALDETNLAPECIGRTQWQESDSIMARSLSMQQPTGSGTFSSTSYQVVAHTALSTEKTFSPSMNLSHRAFVVAQFHCLVSAVSVDAAKYAEDRYWFRVGYKSGGSWVYPATAYGFSMLVRNSGGTMSTDSNIDTSTYDLKNFHRYRHVDITAAFPVSTSTDITEMRWEVRVEDSDNSVTIAQFLASYLCFQG
jgi:hypothetical protein